MNIPLSIIENTFTHRKYGIPKVNKNVLYICLETYCGYQVVSELEAVNIGGRYTGSNICPGCGCTLWKIIK